MEGHVRERGKGNWYAVFDLGKVDGKRKQKWQKLDAKNKREAEKAMRAILTEVDNHTYVAPSKDTLAAFLERWFRDVAEHNVGDRTLEGYRRDARNHILPRLGDTPLTKLAPLQIQEAYSEILKKVSPGTLRNIHKVLSSALKWAIECGVLVRNPLDAVKLPPVETPEAEAIDEVQTMRMLDKLKGTGIYIPSLIAATTGMRRGEILALRWSDIDLDGKVLVVNQALVKVNGEFIFKGPKTKRGHRAITLPKMLVDALKAYKIEQSQRRWEKQDEWQDYGLVCDNGTGGPITPTALSANFGRYVKRLKLTHVKFHGLRHSHASQLIKDGEDLITVSRRLGHSKTSVTSDTYAHMLNGMDRAAADRIDSLLKTAKDARK